MKVDSINNTMWRSSLLLFYLQFLRFLMAEDFHLYPAVNQTLLANAYGLSTECIQALNTTLTGCDATLFQMAVNFDNYYWEDDNLTTLCNDNCQVVAFDWAWNVGDACTNEFYPSNGVLLPAQSVADRYLENLKTACLFEPEDGHWCLTASQNWTGSTVIQPNCDASPTDPACTGDDSMNTRMANIYPDSMLCDTCFIQMLHARVTSLFLPDSDYSDYLVDQIQDIGDVCNTTIPNITLRALPEYVEAPTSTTSRPPATTTCAGQIIGPDVSSGCNTLSTKYGVTTGDLEVFSQGSTCAISNSTCFPAACSLQQVPSDATCDSLAASISSGVTTIQFLNWNRNILGLCDSVTPGQYVCVSAPGVKGTYTLAPPPLGSDANGGNQQRGGPGGVVTPTGCHVYTNPPVTAPGPTQTGIPEACNAYNTPLNGTGCVDFAKENCLTMDELCEYNPVLGPDGQNCAQAFWKGEYYCVNLAPNSTTTSVAQPTTSAYTSTAVSTPTIVTGTAAPGPTQSGISSSCNVYAQAAKGSGCYDFAAANHITEAQLYAWNPVLGSQGENCGSSFWAGEWYCVGVSGGAFVVQKPGYAIRVDELK